MKRRQTIENYWSVWIFNPRLGDGTWEPYDEGMTTRAAAAKSMREESKKWPEDRFAIVKTKHQRVTTQPPGW